MNFITSRSHVKNHLLSFHSFLVLQCNGLSLLLKNFEFRLKKYPTNTVKHVL
uniref:Uncharacterized protein n=1 Tax=Rhizophora mucronata TaxID=61149 RepID=A0A2P2LNQ2_RHIMU